MTKVRIGSNIKIKFKEVFIIGKKIYKYEEYHKEIDNVLYKKCAYHEGIFGEEKWLPCTEEYFYKNTKNKSDGLYPECKECTKVKSIEWSKENYERRKEILSKSQSKPERKDYVNGIKKKQKERGMFTKWRRENKDKVKEYNKLRYHKKHKISNKEWLDCKEYFNYQCAYCGISETEHKKLYNEQLHKEHVIHDGSNDITNCIPACKSCNSSKRNYDMQDWYKQQKFYDINKLDKIILWLKWMKIKSR